MESKKISQLATELTPDLSDLTIIGDPTTGISKKITLSQMASLFTGTVEEYATLAAFPLVGVADTIYIALDTNVIYRYDTSLSAYVILSPNVINSLVFSDANGFDGTIALVGSVATLTITTALTTGSVPFIGASGALSQDNANLFFDDTNNRLGINTNAPTTAIDAFGSGIIGRINGTSTNNSFLGFASAGTNKWSIGNVQSDHRFRIYNEAATSELFTILPTGEIGIGIANPFANLHIDGGASINRVIMDANINVAKIFSFRSDNSPRWAFRVDGTESGSNAGADFAIRRYTDAGAFIDAPLTITRSTGITTIKELTLTNVLSIANGGTGSATQNFVDLTSIQTAAGAKTFSAITTISNATASTSTTTGGLVITGGVGIGGALYGTTATFKVIPTRNLAIKYDSNITLSAQDDGGAPESLRMYADTFRIYTATTTVGLTQRFTIGNTGNVGINTASPTNGKLEVQTTATSAALWVQTGGTTNSYIIADFRTGSNASALQILGNANVLIGSTTDQGSWKAQVTGNMFIRGNNTTSANTGLYMDDSSGNILFYVRNDGSINTGTRTNSPYNYSTSGRSAVIESNGNFGYLVSTRESKGNIESIKSIDFINKLNPVQFNYRKKDDINNTFTDELYDNITYGFIADEVEEVNKELVMYNEDGSLGGVEYNSMIAILTKAVQELKTEVELLKAK